MNTTSNCPFCDIVTGRGPARVIDSWPDAIAFAPIQGGVTPGHALVVPRAHVADAIVDPVVTGISVIRAAALAAQMIKDEEMPGANLITSHRPPPRGRATACACHGHHGHGALADN
jgi:histidine triad (HIT) family protein